MALSLIFLAHGRVPVWATKLEVPGVPWNNRPNDLYFLSQHISDYREGPVNFYTMSIDHPAEELIATPVAYISSDRALELSPQRMANLRRYLDLGGMLVANPEQGSSAFHASVMTLGEMLYPELQWQRAGEDHPLFSILFNIDHHRHTIQVLNNGVRDLIVLPQHDWGLAWQADRNLLAPESRRDTGRLTMNLFALATNRGVLPNRLESDFETRDADVQAQGQVRIGIARHEGNWLIEPAVWDVAGNRLFNATGLEARTVGLPEVPALGEADDRGGGPVLDLSAIADSEVDLVHLQGIEAVPLGSSEIDAIRRYVEGGGTVLVETVGGRGEFARDVERQLRGVFDTRRALPVGAEDPLLSGEQIGGYDVGRISFRRYTTFRLGLPPEPRLRAMYVDDRQRPGVIFSDEDLSLGALGVRRWGIIGYAAEDARRLLTNIALTARR